MKTESMFRSTFLSNKTEDPEASFMLIIPIISQYLNANHLSHSTHYAGANSDLCSYIKTISG